MSDFSGDGAFWRRVAFVASARGPRVLLRGAPPIVGTIFWAIRPRQRAGVRENLRRILGPRSPWREARDEVRTFVAFARSFAEGFAALGPRAVEVHVDVEGEERFREITARGDGCILATAHTSSFEMAGAVLHRTLGVDVVMAMRPEAEARAREISDASREGAGLRVVHVGDDPLAALELARHLRRGAAVGLQIDRLPPGLRGIEVTFFGAPRELPFGPFALARATGAPILPVFTRRTGFLRASVRACEPIHLDKNATREEMAVAAQKVADELEAWVRAAPNEWLDWG